MNYSCSVSVVIPTWQRKAQLSETLKKIQMCNPYPAEILVHIDAGDEETLPWLSENFTNIRVLKSTSRMGPGGGRNKLIAAAKYPVVASFDDDSYPLDPDYFERLVFCFDRYPDMSILASHIIEQHEQIVKDYKLIGITSQFIGCGVAYRRKDFLASTGYVTLPVAYGMEEIDLCLQFFNMGKKIYFSPWLRVFHNSPLAHHKNPEITSASISNLALLAFLRYPKRYWFYGMLQVINRVVWLVRAGRFTGISQGLMQIPLHLWRHRHLRKPVSATAVQNFLHIRKAKISPEPLPKFNS